MACCTVSGLHIVTPLFCNTFASTITISDAVRMQQPNTKRSLEPRHSCGYLSPKPSVTESTFTLEADVLSLRPSPNPPASTQLGGAEWEGTPFGPYPVEQNSNTDRAFLSFTTPSRYDHNCPATRHTCHTITPWGKRLALLSTTQNQL